MKHPDLFLSHLMLAVAIGIGTVSAILAVWGTALLSRAYVRGSLAIRVVLIVLSTWLSGVIIAFLGGALLGLRLLPNNLSLVVPLSFIGDFAASPSGDVYVISEFYGRVLHFNKEGRILRSCSTPGKGSKLAISESGRLFLGGSFVYELDESSCDLRLIGDDDNYLGGYRTWELGSDGQPSLAPHRSGEKLMFRVVSPGGLLFSQVRVDFGEKHFLCSDGAVLRKYIWGVKKVSSEGDVLETYSTPMLLRPFVFPLPGFLVVAVGLIALVSQRGIRGTGVSEVYRLQSNPNPIMQMALHKYRSKEYAEAASLFDELLKISSVDNGSILGSMGLAYFFSEQYAKAADAFRRALIMVPDDVKHTANLLSALTSSSEYAEAIRLGNDYLSRRPDNAHVRYNLACAYAKSGYFDNAFEELKRAVSLSRQLKDEAKRDECFESLMNKPGFSDLLK